MGNFLQSPDSFALGGKGFFGTQPVVTPTSIVWNTLVTGFESSTDLFSTIQFVNGHWIISATPSGRPPSIFYSSDGVTWNQQLLDNFFFADYICSGVAFGAGLYATVGLQLGNTNSPALWTSPDLATWTRHPGALAAIFPNTDAVSAPVFGAGIFLIVSRSGDVFATSSDGITWTAHSNFTPSSWNQPVYNGSAFFAAVNNGANTLVTSSDGVHWTTVSNTLDVTPGFPTPIATDGAVQLVIGDDNTDVGDSFNGSFQQTSITFNDPGNPTAGLAFGNGSWARVNAATSNPQAQSSSDGLQWSQDNTDCVPNHIFIGSVAFGQNKFIAVGNNNSNTNFAMTRSV